MPPADRIEELKKKFDENPRRYFAPLANEYRKAGDLAQAISICRTHLPQQPGHMSGHIVYGQALFESGELDEARSVFQTALELDPENLIALRHLGDIALRTGDEAEARRWYERVLETDPRNEEITALLQGMAPASAPPAAPAPPPIQAPSPLDAVAADLSGADDPQAVNLDARSEGVELIPAHVAEPPATAGETPFELLDLSTELPGSAPVSPPAPSRAVESRAVESRAGGGGDLLDFDSSMFVHPAGHAATGDQPPLDATATSLGTDEQESETAGADASLLDGLEPTHFEGSSADQPQPTLAGLEPQAFEPPPPEVQPPRISQAFPPVEEFAGLSHAHEPGDSTPLQAPPAGPAPAEASPFVASLPEFDELPAPATAAEDAPPAGVPVRPTPAAATAFVTETMAELYLQQGLHDRAADVYRQLLEQRPDDAGLRERLRDVEARMAAASAPTPAVAMMAVEEGPSIREFLGRFAARRPRDAVSYVPTPPAPRAAEEPLPDFDAQRAEPPMGMGASQVEPIDLTEPEQDDSDSASVALPFIEPYDEERASEPVPAPAPTPTVAGSDVAATPEPGAISAIFAGTVSDDDEARATRLASAFSPVADEDPTPPATPSGTGAVPSVSSAATSDGDDDDAVLPSAGRPARPAESELALDRVFREPRPSGGRRSSTGFSFDQFFSKTEGSAPPAPAPRGPEVGEAPAAGADDIAQFNAWLQGLKNK
ncbi:MAG: tetratricopeptide repeat protein [Gemmatimonadaceae bacterium]